MFALAWRKKKDERELYLLVDGPAFQMVARVNPKQGDDARKFAAAINTAARGGAIALPHDGAKMETRQAKAAALGTSIGTFLGKRAAKRAAKRAPE